MEKTDISTVFSVTLLCMSVDLCEDVICTCRYPISAWKDDIGIYSSLEKAEAAMSSYMKYNQWQKIDIIGIHIVERKLDFGYCDENKDCPEFESIRMYDNDCNFVTSMDEPYLESDTFAGRDDIRHEVGDYVLVLDGSRLVPSKVVALPMTHDEWKNTHKSGVNGDWTDDCYTVVHDSFHSHPSVVDVFPVPVELALNAEIIAKLDEQEKEYFTGLTKN